MIAFKNERNSLVYGMRLNGYTFKAIGNFFGISPERVRQIFIRQFKTESHAEIFHDNSKWGKSLKFSSRKL